ncbi:MAG: trypsin-like peptidase domain-containing protein [Gemmataceae bacterium]
MEFKVPPREAITCPQCNEYLEDVTPRAAAAPTVMQPARVPTQLEEAEAETAPPRKRAAASPTVVQKARALTKAQPAAQPTVVQPVRETTQLEPVPLQQDEEPQLSGNLDEEEIHEPAGLPDSEDVGLAPEESAEAPAPEEPNLDLAAEAEPEEPAEPSESIVTEEEHKRQAGKKGLVKVQARRVATRMLGRKQQPTMPAVAKKVIVDQEDDDDEEEDDDDNGKPIRLAPAAGDEDDDDDNEAAPRRKLKPAVILTYVGVAAALAFAVPRLLEVAKPYLEDDKKQVAKAVPAPQPAPAPQPPAPQPQPEKPPVTEQPKAEKPPERPVVELPVMPAPRAELKPDEIYKQLLHSSVLIVGANEKEFSIGTGSLVHVDKKLVLTNQHVVMNQRDLAVIFPEYKDGEVIADPLHYEKKEIKGKVVAHDATRDLALIELEKVPDSVKALPLARKSVAPGAKVYSIGSSGAGRRTLWRFSEGSVRQVSYLEAKQRRSGILFKGHVVETQSPVNPGDSGGAVVNGQMELCAVVSMSDRSSDLVSQCVDIREVRAFLDSYGQARGLKWQENAAPVDNSADIERIVLQLLPILEKGTPNEKAKALGVLLDAGPSGRAAIPTLLHIIKGDDEELRRLALLALDRMGTPTEKALPHLREALESEHLLVRRHAALMAARMGKGARTLVPKLLPLLAERDHDTVVAALRAVAAIGPDARAAANRLLILLAREESDLSLNAAEALAAIGKLPAEEAGPAAALLDNPRSLVHITAAGALLTARDDERARALLAAVLRDTNDELVHALAFRFLNE